MLIGVPDISFPTGLSEIAVKLLVFIAELIKSQQYWCVN